LHAFTQADARLARTYKGLDPAYVDQMVHLLGGTIALASTPDQGSRFTVTLPAKRCAPTRLLSSRERACALRL
jgi:signal transduction histidine kinase